MASVTAKNVSFTYATASAPALRDISFSLDKGTVCLVAGRSAAGKSTLLKLLKKEIAPAGSLQGTLCVDGTVGYVSQRVEESIVCDTVRGELSFGLTNLGLDEEAIWLATAEAAAYFHLENKLDSKIADLSGGEKQLVNLAAVMMMRPAVLLLDEPCAQLDPLAAEQLMNAVTKLRRDFHCTVLLSEHSNPEAFALADSVLWLEEGRLLCFGTKETVVKSIAEEHNELSALLPLAYRLQPDGREAKAPLPDGKANTALQAKGITFAYERGNDVLRNLSLSVFRGKVNAVIGANGCGKTTLLKVLCGVRKPYRGKVKAAGTLSMLTQNVYDLFTRERCGDEVAFGDLTDFLGISELADVHPYDLSGGQAQRLALAKVLERQADIILLDEPTKGLDALLKSKLATLLQQLCARGKTILLVSHDLDFIAETADYVSFMSRGSILLTGTAGNVFRSLRFYTTSLARLTDGKVISLKEYHNA